MQLITMNNLEMSPSSKNKYKLKEPYYFYYEEKVKAIPKGFEFDGASIPRIFWTIVGTPFDPEYVEAALMHDYMLENGFGVTASDRFFKVNLEFAKVNKYKLMVMYGAVRLYHNIKRLL